MASYFPISYTPGLRPMFWLLGIGPAQSGAWIEANALRVKMGWAFSATLPQASISQVAHDDGPVTGWGVHGGRGTWLVNGSSSGLVRLDLDPGVSARVLGLRVRLRTLRLSLETPEALVSELAARR